MQILQVAIRALQLLWVVLLTALIGNVIALNNDAAGSAEAAVNFSMFVIVLSWLVVLYGLVAAVVESLSIPIAVLAADLLATLFTLIDGIGTSSGKNFALDGSRSSSATVWKGQLLTNS